jgi:hypothetical protein
MRFFYFILFILLTNLTFAQVGSNDNKNEEILFSVNPNPADNFLTISLNSNSDATLRLFDVLGKAILEERISGSRKISTEDFKNGVYIVSVSSNGNVSTKRIVVKH